MLILSLLVFLFVAGLAFKSFKIQYCKINTIQKTVAIQPFIAFPNSLCILLEKNIKEFYHLQVITLPEIPLPKSSYYQARNRFRADTLIRFLKRTIPKNCNYCIGLTTKDISVTNGDIPDYGIFGLGYCPGVSCVVSTYRYSKNISEELFKERFIKICLHELGHNMGLPHCKMQNCLMNDAEGKISTVDHEKMQLCNKCKTILRLNIF